MPASSSAIRAGRAFVELFADDTKLVRGLRRAQAKLNAFGAAVTQIGARIAALGAGLATPFTFAIRAASDAEEVASKFGVVFGENAAAVRAWGDEFAEQVGRGKTEIASFLAGAQDLFVPLGFDPREAEELSKQVTQLAVDLGSFNNMADADVMRDLQAALTGSGETMKKYGVLVSEAAVKQELLNQNIDPKAATDQQKVLARLNLILRGTTAAQGDAVRTAGGFANQMKALKASFIDTAEVVGGALLPVVTPMVGVFREAARFAGQFAAENSGLVVGVAAGAVGLVAAGSALVGLGLAAKLAAVGFGVVATAVSALGAVLGAILSPLGIVTGALVGGVGAWLVYSDSGQAALASIGQRLAAFKADALATFQGIVDALAAGDLQLAGEVALAGLNVAWQTGLNALMGAWTTTRDLLIATWQELGATIHRIWAEVVSALVNLTAQIGTSIQGFFENAAADALALLGVISDAEAEAAKAQLERNRQAELGRVRDDFDAARATADIERALTEAAQARARGTAEEIRAAEQALDRARARLAESVGRAAAARANAPSAAAAPARPMLAVPAELDAIADKLGAAADVMVRSGDQIPEAMLLGTREAAEAILRHEAGRDQQDRLHRDQLAEQRKATRALEDIDRNLRNVATLAVANIT